MLKTIKLYGVLAKKFGKQFRLDVASPKEAARALSVQVPGFEQFMLNAHEQGLMFAVFVDKANITEQQIDMSTGASVIKIVPRVMGAGGGGVLNVVLGAALIAGAFFTGGATLSAWGALQVGLAGAGLGLAIGGVAMMLMPKVDVNTGVNQDGNRPNHGFGQAATTVAQGYPVPILCGRREIGGFVASAGQYPEDQM